MQARNTHMKQAKGFTLIEVLVSVAIFAVVMVIALGALLSISTANRKAESLKSVINNLNFAIDSMSRSVRTGSSWTCGAGGDCTSGANVIGFIPPGGSSQRTWYRLSTDNSLCNQTGTAGCIIKSTNSVTGQTSSGSWSSITSPEVIISDFSAGSPASYLFYVVGSAPGTDPSPLNAATQPKLVITLSGFVTVSGGATTLAQCAATGNQCSIFRLQTTVVQRIYDQ